MISRRNINDIISAKNVNAKLTGSKKKFLHYLLAEKNWLSFVSDGCLTEREGGNTKA